ncbi:MAG TPA: hypothetical protein VGC92_01380 [Phenylobacterium sp.]|jgi:hypothetical protein
MEVETKIVRVTGPELETHGAAVAQADRLLAQIRENIPACPECGGQRIATVQRLTGLCDVAGVLTNGLLVHEDGTDVCWNSQQTVACDAGILLHCRDCDHEWHQAGLEVAE